MKMLGKQTINIPESRVNDEGVQTFWTKNNLSVDEAYNK